MTAMTIPHRLDNITGNLAAVESIFLLLALHLARTELLSLEQLIDDMEMLGSLSDDGDLNIAQLRILNTLRALRTVL